MSRPSTIDPSQLPVRNTSGYPEPYRSRVLPREKRALGDAFGLTKVGINLTTLPPGKESSMRHWHTREDEFIYVVEGEVVMRNDAGEHVLRAGTCAGFPAGVENGHQLINKSDRPARYLEISNRDPEDGATYSDPDVDLAYGKAPDGTGRFTRKDGTPI
ncbi:MAG: cupin domain-containing protein [Deltaproteobacteria bacterium]|nr:cupin domain-containing protein [Deltaproteobacteria bacterium]